MLSRLLQLYWNGGLKEVHAGVIRFLRVQRREYLYGLLRQTSDPKRWLRAYIRLRKRMQITQYTDADPFKIIYVDPDDISYRVTNTPTEWGKIAGGKWKRKPFEKIMVHGSYFHKSNVLHFEDGVPWEETPIYQARMKRPENNLRGHTTNEDVERYFEQLDEIYRDISKNGYRTQKELLYENPSDAYSSNNDEIHPILNEIGVNIDESGEYLWSRCGKHRLSIAKILDLDQVPVQVRTRHKTWQQIRNEIRNASSIDELSKSAIDLIDHPDFVDIISKSCNKN